MESSIGEFIAKILTTLKKSGYPEKRVALPLEKMYEAASKNGYSFNKVLDFLREKEGIDHEKTEQKIIFFPLSQVNEATQETAGGPQFFDLMKQAAEYVKHLSPDQIAQIQKMVENLSQEEKEDLLKKAKDWGFPG